MLTGARLLSLAKSIYKQRMILAFHSFFTAPLVSLTTSLLLSFDLEASGEYEMFEGDLWLPKEQIEAAKNGMDPTNIGGVRGLSRHNKWPGGIVYYTISTSK